MILITGGTGLLGSHLLFELAKKQEKIRALKRVHSDLSIVQNVFADAPELIQNIEWFDCDILDTETLNLVFSDVDFVYHNAAMVSFNPKDVELMLKTNVEGTENIVNLCLNHQVKKLVHASSVAALGRNFNSENINEETHWRTLKENSNYAISKYGAEREVWRGIAEGLNAVIVNPSIIIGPGIWNVNGGALIKYVYDERMFYPEGSTGFVDVRDVAQCMMLLMSSEITAERFVINSENVSYKTLMDWAADALHKSKSKIKVTPLISEVGWRGEKIKSLLTGKSPMITKETARTSMKKYFYSSQKIKAAIGINFIPMKESVEWTCGKLLQEMK
ncbi:MAG: NAD-dependent epimerase/dehydratase family protein [Bacteroidia bacterium]